ncbi:MAG: hypothetical protein ACTHMS_20730, partial [Jatrophihabitans sp.]
MPHDTTQGRQHRASKIQSRRKAGTAAGVCSVILAVGAVAATSGADPAGSATLTPQPIASDAFGRTVASGLGTADLGGAYSVMAPSNVGVSVSGARASFTSIRPGQSIAATLPATGTDEQMRTSIVVPKFNSSTGPLYFGVELRRQADGRGYRASVGIDPSGKLTLGLSRLGVNRAETSLAYKTLTLKVTPGQVLDLEGLVSGSAPVGLSVRAWLDGTAVPAWQLTYNDSAGTLPQTGSIGEWAYLSSSGATLGFQQTALAAWNLVAAAPAPAPAPTTSSTTTSPAPTTSSTTSSPAPSPTSSSVAPTSSATATSAPAPSPTSTTTSAPAPSPTTTTTSAPAPAPTTS